LHAKDPADRFSSAAELADLLAGCLAHVRQPASIPLPAALRTVGRGRRAAASVLGLLLVLVVLGAWLFPRPARKEEPEPAPPATVPTAPVKRSPTPQTRSTPALGEPLDQYIGEMHQRAAALEADLKQPAGAQADPVRGELNDVQRRLDGVRRELTAQKR
jgi:hypothetical protein